MKQLFCCNGMCYNERYEKVKELEDMREDEEREF